MEVPSSYYVQDLNDLGLILVCLATGVAAVLYVMYLASDDRNK